MLYPEVFELVEVVAVPVVQVVRSIINTMPEMEARGDHFRWRAASFE
jgi:hypothetical protein